MGLYFQARIEPKEIKSQTIDVGPHPVSRVLSHLVSHMPVYVQSKSNRASPKFSDTVLMSSPFCKLIVTNI